MAEGIKFELQGKAKDLDYSGVPTGLQDLLNMKLRVQGSRYAVTFLKASVVKQQSIVERIALCDMLLWPDGGQPSHRSIHPTPVGGLGLKGLKVLNTIGKHIRSPTFWAPTQ